MNCYFLSMIKSVFRIFILTCCLTTGHLLSSQSLIKIDAFSFIRSGVGLTYEQYLTHNLSLEVAAQNIALGTQCVDLFCEDVFDNVGRSWHGLANIKYNYRSKNTKHVISVGFGVSYTKWYQVSDAYSEKHIAVFTREPEEIDGVFSNPITFEYNFMFRPAWGIGIRLPYLDSYDSPAFLNITYNLSPQKWIANKKSKLTAL